MSAARFFWGDAVHLGRSERVLWDKYRQTYDGAASEVDDVVDGDHLQVQHHLSGALDGPWQDECGAHITGLLWDEEDRRGMWVERAGKHWNLTAAHDGGNPGLQELLSYRSQPANTCTKSRRVNVFSTVREVRAGLVQTRTTEGNWVRYLKISCGWLNHTWLNGYNLNSSWKVSLKFVFKTFEK